MSTSDYRKIVLVSMPWAPATEPSLALAILRACLVRDGYPVEVFHASAHLLRWVSLKTNVFVAESWALNEFVFTKALDEELDEQQLSMLVRRSALHARDSRHERYSSALSACDLFLTLREEVIPKFLIDCAERILKLRPALVGFTCMFDQTIASAALAKLLKAHSPDLKIAMGGYALEGPPGDVVARAFPWIDYLVRGDGEKAITELAKSVTGNLNLRSEVKAPQHRTDVFRVIEPVPDRLVRAPSVDLNASPVPDYNDWIKDVGELSADRQIAIRTKAFPVESSRGCWWGQHKHCIFCGIDERTLQYRNKSPEAVLAMLHELRERHGKEICFRFSDYILPKHFYDKLLTKLAEVEPQFRLTGEIKANQTLDRMRLFARAGFYELQPGIESFSTPLLKLMDKGVRGIDNVALLKYGYLCRIVIQYNFLYGFPGENLEDYEQMAEQLPSLYHFTPPMSRTPVVVTRFAPLQTSPERFAAARIPTHHECYDVLFSQKFRTKSQFELDDYCYYFRRNFDLNDSLNRLHHILVSQINHWKNQQIERSVTLSFEAAADGTISVSDSRFGPEKRFNLTRIASQVYTMCDERPVNWTRLQRDVAERSGFTGSEISEALHELSEERLIWKENDFIFGLAVPASIAQERTSANWNRQWTSLYC